MCVCVCVFTLTRVSNPPSYGMQPPFLHRVHHNHFLSLLPSLCLDPEHSTDTNNILTCTRTYVHHCESTTTKPQHLQAHHCHILTYFQTSTKLTDAATQVLCVFSSSWPPSWKCAWHQIETRTLSIDVYLPEEQSCQISSWSDLKW